MNTRAGTITGGGIGIRADGGRSVWGRGAEKFGGGFAGFCRWVTDRFDFWIVHQGERLKPEIAADLEESWRREAAGDFSHLSPRFDNTEDAIAWLDSQCEDEGGDENEGSSV